MLRASGVTDAGRVRARNEDRFVCDPALGLFAVADGMGGHKAGEVAAQLAIDALTGFIARDDADDDGPEWPYGLDDALSFDGNRLRTAIVLANRKVFRAAEGSDDCGGMGTTIAGVLVTGDRAVIGSVGDSRVYVWSDGIFDQLTTDDSWAATVLAQDPALRPEDIAGHPMRNVLTSVLGGRPTLEVRVTERTLSDGDVLVLCSDGVHGVLEPAVFDALLRETTAEAEIARRLVDLALDRGSQDNVTAVVVRFTSER